MDLKTEGLPEIANQVKDTYDYLTGKRTHNLSGLVDATDEEIKTCPDLSKFVDSFDEAEGDIDVKIDSTKKNFLVTFSATRVPKDLADQVKPGGQYYNMINRYDKGSKNVEMIFTVPSQESVMQPIPTPYKPDSKRKKVEEGRSVGYDFVERKDVVDADGFTTDYTWYKSTDGVNVFVFGDRDYYAPADGDFDFETEDDLEARKWFDNYRGPGEEDISEDEMFESLIETAGLDTSVLVRRVNDDGKDSIDMDINGRVYNFTMKDESPYSIDQMFHKVSKMRNYSEGRALAFMKKNMIGKRVESVERSSKCEGLLREEFNSKKTITLTVNDPEGKIEDLIAYIKDNSDSGHSFKVRVDDEGDDRYKEFWVDGDGSDRILDIKVSQEEKVEESKNPFKDKHVCQGCGKPLSQCTCDIEEEFSQGSATQPSSVGQHKRGFLDMFPEK